MFLDAENIPMNSVLFHDPEKANQLAGRYTMGLTDVYQTLHDRLLQALQKWIPPSDKPEDVISATAAASSPQSQLSPVGNPIDLPVFYPLNTDGIDTGPGGIQLDLNNIRLLLAKSSTSSSSMQQQTSRALSTDSVAVTAVSTPFSSESAPVKNNQNDDNTSTNNNSKNNANSTLSQSRFHFPLTVCTAGPQYARSEQVSTTTTLSDLHARSGKNGFHAKNADSMAPSVHGQGTSLNLLHQLLSGADMSQVRTRSELIEPGLCTKSLSEPFDSESKPPVTITTANTTNSNNRHPYSVAQSHHSTPNKSHIGELLGGNESIDQSTTNTHRTVCFQSTIPTCALHPTHSPMDVTTCNSMVTEVPTSTFNNPSMIQPPPVAYSSLGENNESVSNNSTLLAEKLLYLLIELQKTQIARALAAAPMNVSPQPNPSPCSATLEGSDTPVSLNSPVTVLSKAATNTVHGIHQFWTTPLPNTTSDCGYSSMQLSNSSKPPVQAQWTNAQQSRYDFPSACESPNQNQQQQAAQPHSDPDYEPRPRSKSDVHNTTRRHIRSSRDHRSRSQTKLDRHGGGRMSATLPELSGGTCELESSLFAQLILSPDSPTSSTPRSTGAGNATRGSSGVAVGVTSGGSSFVSSRNCTSTRDLMPSPSKPAMLTEDSAALVCHTECRTQVFEWLRESDLFVAEHCFDIPLGALLATAISPGRSNLAEICCSALFTPNPPTDPVPALAKHVVNKLWHQLLLVSLIENDFVPRVTKEPLSPHQCSGAGSGPFWSESHSQPLRDKVLNAISSLAALDVEESPAPDEHLVAELKRLVSGGTQLKLTPELFRLVRFCILAQNAYPHHFSTTYSEALSELEAELAVTPDSPALTDVLKLLNHLHCFDAGTLKQFFGLSYDPTGATGASVRTAISDASPSEWSSGSTSFKRKAHGDEGLPNRDRSIDRDSSPVQFRSRAYTTTECNKSARLCATSISTIQVADSLVNPSASGAARVQGRPRSDTVPTDYHHHHPPRRAERPWKIGTR